MKTNIAFNTEDGVTLAGWFYAAKGVTGAAPTVVMSHGFSAVKEMYLGDFAEVFQAAGLNVLVYDNRNIGASGGAPRGELDPEQQIRDYRDAITYAQSLDTVDSDRIGIWGSSYSGGHVLVVAARDRRVKCVVAQVPLVHGLANARTLVRLDHWGGLRAAFVADRQARLAGAAPQMIPVVGEEPGGPCALPTEDSREFFLTLSDDRRGGWKNEVTLRSVEMFTEYEPGDSISRIGPTPLMMVVALKDHLTPADMALSAYNSALEPKRLLTLDCGHFDAYIDEPFKISSKAQCEWFATHLK